jgi:hypothetical protein
MATLVIGTGPEGASPSFCRSSDSIASRAARRRTVSDSPAKMPTRSTGASSRFVFAAPLALRSAWALTRALSFLQNCFDFWTMGGGLGVDYRALYDIPPEGWVTSCVLLPFRRLYHADLALL